MLATNKKAETITPPPHPGHTANGLFVSAFRSFLNSYFFRCLLFGRHFLSSRHALCSFESCGVGKNSMVLTFYANVNRQKELGNHGE